MKPDLQKDGKKINRTPRTRACIVCRQDKHKCDSYNTFPGPCSRCASLGTECRIDPNYKRISASTRYERISKQLVILENKTIKPPNINMIGTSLVTNATTSPLVERNVLNTSGSSPNDFSLSGYIKPKTYFGLKDGSSSGIGAQYLGDVVIDENTLENCFRL